jgi:hypothetical protein
MRAAVGVGMHRGAVAMAIAAERRVVEGGVHRGGMLRRRRAQSPQTMVACNSAPIAPQLSTT